MIALRVPGVSSRSSSYRLKRDIGFWAEMTRPKSKMMADGFYHIHSLTWIDNRSTITDIPLLAGRNPNR
jgi:hypothetical protein